MSASKFFRNFLAFLPHKKSKDNSCHKTREKGHQNYDLEMQKTQAGERCPAPDVECKREFQFPETVDHSSHQSHEKLSEDSPTTDPNETLNQPVHLNLQVTGRTTSEEDIDRNLCGTEENGRAEVDTVTGNGHSCSSEIEKKIKNNSAAECVQSSSPNAEIHANGICPVGFNHWFNTSLIADGSLKDEITEEDVVAPTSIFDKVFQDHVNELHATPKTNDLEEFHRTSCLDAEQQLLHLNIPLVNTDVVDVKLSTESQSEKIDDVAIKIGLRPVATYDDECISISSSDTEIFEAADHQDIEMEEEEVHEDTEVREEETEAVVATRDVINISESGDIYSQFQSRVKSNETQEKTSKDVALSSNSYVVERLPDISRHVDTSNLQLEDSKIQEVLSRVIAESDRSAATNTSSLLYNKSISTSNVTIMPGTIKKAQSNQICQIDSSNVVKKKRISIAAGVVYEEEEVSSLAVSQLSTMTQTLLPSVQSYGISNRGTSTSFLSLPSNQPYFISNSGTPTSVLSLPSIQPYGISNPGAPTSVLSLASIQPHGISNPGTPASVLSLPSIQTYYLISNPGTPTSFLSLPSLQPYVISNPGTPTSFLSLSSIQPHGISNLGTATSFLSLPSIQPYVISNHGTPTSFLSLPSIQPYGTSNHGTPTSFLSVPSTQPHGINNTCKPTSFLSLQSIQPHGIGNHGTPTSFLSLPSTQPNVISNPGTPTSFLSLPSTQPNVISNPGTPTSFLSLSSTRPHGISNRGKPSLVRPVVLSNLPPGSTVVLNGGSCVTKDKEGQHHLSQNLISAGPSQGESFSCVRCNMHFPLKSDLYHHKCAHRPFSCSTCKMSFRMKEDLVVHYNHPEDCRVDVICTICKKVFRISSALKRLFMFLSGEKSLSHEGDTEVDSPGSSSISKPLPSSNHLEVEKDAPAPFSGPAYDDRRTSSAYCSHIESTISSKVPPGATLFNVRGLFRIKDTENPFACGYCGKTYKLKHSLYGHITLQHNEKCFSCEFCGKRYVRECELLIHVTMHTQEKPFTCDQCGMQFRLKGGLRNHKLTHSEERLYACNKCDKSFKTYNVLAKHKESHDVERRECSICKRTFSAATNLKEHMMIHTGEKPFKCTLCEKQFRVKQQLQIHMNSHSGKKGLAKNPCSVCGKNVWNSYMATHKRMHSGEKPYECNICKKRFPKKINLEGHMRSHTGEKPFACSGCDKRFALYSNMMTHKAKCTTLSGNAT